MSIRVQIVTQEWNPISAAIRLMTRSWASHIELVDTVSRTTLGARSSGGVKVRDCKDDHYSRIEQFTCSGLDKMWAWGLTQVGKPYDYSGICGIIFNHDWADDKRWFCADFFQAAGVATGYPQLSTRPSNFIGHYTPRDFLLSRTLYYIGPALKIALDNPRSLI